MKDCKDLMESAKNDDGSCIQWLNFFPEYGCLVVAHSHDQHSLVGTVRVKVLGLDAYEFGLHPRTEDRTYDHVSHAGKFKPIDVGRCTARTLTDSKRACSKSCRLLEHNVEETADPPVAVSRGTSIHQHSFMPLRGKPKHVHAPLRKNAIAPRLFQRAPLPTMVDTLEVSRAIQAFHWCGRFFSGA
jgi:hypothetical protein